MAQTTDQRLFALDGDALRAALHEEVEAQAAHIGDFIETAALRLAGEQVVCFQQMRVGLHTARTHPGAGVDITNLFAAASVEAALPRMGRIGVEWAAGLMAMGYALALADIAASPPED